LVQKEKPVDAEKAEAQDDQQQVHPEIPKNRDEKDQHTAGKHDEHHGGKQDPMQGCGSCAGAQEGTAEPNIGQSQRNSHHLSGFFERFHHNTSFAKTAVPNHWGNPAVQSASSLNAWTNFVKSEQKAGGAVGRPQAVPAD
jgi:hypothetical protein